MRTLTLALFLSLACGAQPALKPVPPPGIEVPAADRAELEAGLARLRAATAKLERHPLLPDVLIFHEAVRYALQYNEFFKPAEIAAAEALLAQGQERAAQLAAGQSPWTTATGLVVRGYVSKIDKSVQPYALVMPPMDGKPHRLDAWFHGRGETLSEVNFLTDRQKNPGEFQPPGAIVLHLYGRFCNANRFAGEVDFFEALDAVKRAYSIDENRILVRGFSMGGASTWQFGTHYPGLWAAVAPGAGFSETKEFLRLREMPAVWEQKLWHLYDSADYAVNLFNVPVIEYHGEIDPQKQAGDVMERAMAAEGLKLPRIEGPQTPHRYHPESKVTLEKMLDPIVEKGRDPNPREVKFTTFTLAYNRMKWLVIDALGQHWERARVDAEADTAAVKVATTNVAAFTLERSAPTVTVDGQAIKTKGSGPLHFRKAGSKWTLAASDRAPGLHKVHGLQGPIDDAFMDSFLFVTPTGKPAAPAVAPWVAGEEKRAIAEWRRQFRGDAQVRDDKDITDRDIAASNLILWGDPGSNRILARIADKLPMRWPAEAAQALILIYPNPLNPKRYVVLNSGFTFREYDYLNNARQTPKLPDYAVIDTTTPPDARYPGKIVQAGFFDEDWKLPAKAAVKRIPADGIDVPAADRAELEAGLARLQAAAAKLKGNPLLPDVLVFSEAVRFSLRYGEFFKPAEIAAAKALLAQGEERAAQLAAGSAPWTSATGLVVRGYVSKIDKSVQPYGLVVPPGSGPYRLDLWFHGRDEALTQVNFLTARQKNPGEFQPPGAIVLHLYGRYCNASKFAGEVDAFEAMDAVKRAYPIDENRILVRGFSMGGASVWHMAAHHAGLWAAAAPGAGFAESAQYLKIKLTGDNAPPWWEQKLWHYYDSVDYAANLFNVPVIEYHGEIDPQKQAGDMMERAMAAEGLKLPRIEGPQTAHKYHSDSKIELARRIDAIADEGRDPSPGVVTLTTYTLTYNRMKWLTIDALDKHWERARVEAVSEGAEIRVTTSNVAALTLQRSASAVAIDGQSIPAKASAAMHFRKTGEKWAQVSADRVPGLHKVHGLQGPIDDAFLDSFLFVTPTGKPKSPDVAPWVASEEGRAIAEWRRQFRGDAQVRDDKDITDADIAASNLVLWGDPGSNRILARIADKLPIRWPDAATQAAILIYPNPLNPKRYVVLNSGFTFREADYLSNARQTPKLPDWAIVDTSVPPDGRFPGKIVQAGFFNEDWK